MQAQNKMPLGRRWDKKATIPFPRPPGRGLGTFCSRILCRRWLWFDHSCHADLCAHLRLLKLASWADHLRFCDSAFGIRDSLRKTGGTIWRASSSRRRSLHGFTLHGCLRACPVIPTTSDLPHRWRTGFMHVLSFLSFHDS